MFVIFFFFQAEDGIRDLTVTGVQTCALPISSSSRSRGGSRRRASAARKCGCSAAACGTTPRSRSEEHTSELQSQSNLVCRLLLEKKKKPSVHDRRTVSPRRRARATYLGRCGD